ncbi:MAG: histidine kinase [Burkholderiales bacterium]|nr:MAG: histidine kinase [Burkholderiales bacterium]
MASLTSANSLPRILVLEPDGLVRGTVSSVCRDLRLADVVQTISCAAAARELVDDSLAACILSLAEGEAAMDLLRRLREGEFACPADMPVALTATTVDGRTAGVLKELRIRRLLLKPFRIRDMVSTVESLLATTAVGQ